MTSYYKSKHWKDLRSQYLTTIEGELVCNECGIQIGMGTPTTRGKYSIHHITPREPKVQDPQPDVDCVDNLRILCKQCHMRKHSHNFKEKVVSDGERFIKEKYPELFQDD